MSRYRVITRHEELATSIGRQPAKDSIANGACREGHIPYRAHRPWESSAGVTRAVMVGTGGAKCLSAESTMTTAKLEEVGQRRKWALKGVT